MSFMWIHQQQQQQSHCHDTMCAFLPLGFVLMTFDLYHDLQWCIFPSPKSNLALRQYYTNLLTPTFLPPRLWPGFLFPIYATYVFLGQCPNIYNWMTFFLYLPLVYRYYTILTRKDRDLRHWWIVILLRAALTYVTIINRYDRNCQGWNNHFLRAIKLR
jgi:hypothetical protein